jgi:transposase
VINAIRAHLAEFGIVAPVGRNGVEQLLGIAADANDKRLPEVARACVAALGAQLRMLKAQILQFDRMIRVWHRSNEASRRLDDIPGVGPVLATALAASIADPKAFRSGRNFSAWIGLVPKQNSTGGKDRLGSISKAVATCARPLPPLRASCRGRGAATKAISVSPLKKVPECGQPNFGLHRASQFHAKVGPKGPLQLLCVFVLPRPRSNRHR